MCWCSSMIIQQYICIAKGTILSSITKQHIFIAIESDVIQYITQYIVWNDIRANIKYCFIALCFMLWCILLHALWLLSGSNSYLILLFCLMPSALWPCALFFVAPLSFYLATCNNLCSLVLVLYGICVLWYDDIIIVLCKMVSCIVVSLLNGLGTVSQVTNILLTGELFKTNCNL